MKKKNQKTLTQLIKEWDKRLKESGFDDIESRKTGALRGSGGDVYLGNKTIETTASNQNRIEIKNEGVCRGYTSLTWKESQAEYFRIASQCLHEKEFKSVLERIIWQLHAEGFTYQEISKELNVSLDRARRAIERMALEFNLRPRLK